MSDIAAKETDRLISAMEKKISRIYSAAQKEMNEKLSKFLKEYGQGLAQKEKDLKAGKITQEQFDSWCKDRATSKRWQEEMIHQLTMDMTNTDKKAMSVVNGYMNNAYAINRNYGVYEVEKGSLINTSFTLYDAHTVERLVKDNPRLLPDPSPDIPAEKRWHKKKITDAITSSILQGESIPAVAKRLQGVADMDNRAAIRNARTAMTGAQNAGRVDAYEYAAEEYGIKVKQQWLATLDDRTRESHRELDGEIVEVGEKFSNGCRYPGDPSGEPEEIYNCRCTLVPVIEGVDQSNAPRNSKLGSMSYDEWKHQHGRRNHDGR